MVVLPLISVVLSGWPFGFASAPYDPRWAMRYPKRAAWMALAGPAGNLVLVVGAVLAIRVGSSAGVFAAPSAVSFDQVVAAPAGGLRLHRPAQNRLHDAYVGSGLASELRAQGDFLSVAACEVRPEARKPVTHVHGP